jgi:hypothetical protein
LRASLVRLRSSFLVLNPLHIASILTGPPLPACPLALGLNPLRDEVCAKVLLREQPIVRRAEDGKVVDRVATTARPRVLVMDLEKLRAVQR